MNEASPFRLGGVAKQYADLDRLDDLIPLWRWRASLDHRLRLARLRFEFVGLDGEEQDELAVEVSEFRHVCVRFANAAYGEQVAA